MSIQDALTTLATQMEQDCLEVLEIPVMRALVMSFAKQLRLLALTQESPKEETPPQTVSSWGFSPIKSAWKAFEDQRQIEQSLLSRHGALLDEDASPVLVPFVGGPLHGDSTMLKEDDTPGKVLVIQGISYLLKEDGLLYYQDPRAGEKVSER